MKLLEVRDLTVKYFDHEAVSSISFSVDEGQWLMIAGPNGAGKSTILNAISRSFPYEGTILFRDEDIRSRKASELAKHLGILAQNHMVGYDFTVNEVVSLGRYAYAKGLFGSRDSSDQKAIDEALAITGLEQLKYHSVLNLSGGEVQRTFLAQLFAQNPDILILDEPANHLDLVYQKQIFELIVKWLRQPGRAVISVVHDLSLAKAYGSHCLLMDKGKTVAYGAAADVLTPGYLDEVYHMDVSAWMQQMLGQWQEKKK